MKRGWQLACALFCLATAPAGAEVLQVRFEDGRPAAELGLQRLEAASLEWYVAANDVVRALGLERFWKPETGKLVIKIGETKLQVTVDTRLVVVGDDDVLLHLPVRYRAGSVYLPLEFLETVLAPAAGPSWHFDRSRLQLTVGGGGADVLGIDYETVSGDTEVRLHLARSFQHRVQATSKELVRVRLFDAVVNPLALVGDAPAPLVRRLRAEQRGSEALLYLELDPNVDGFDASTRDGGRTLVILLRRGLEPTPQPEFKLPETAQRESFRPEGAARRGCSVLLLDAGHGGDDAGVRGSGLVEKDLTLELANRLRPQLEAALPLRVELLRSSDRSITDERRAELANKSGGDILVSLHCNGAFSPGASGFEVLFVGPHTVGNRAQTAAAGNFLPWQNAQGPYATRSQQLAQVLQTELGKRLSLPNRGAREANLTFLRGVAMPAVVVEVGFLTNAGEAGTLQSPEYATQLAAGIAAAVQRLCDRSAAEGERMGWVDEPESEAAKR
ncbi:MAG TPA: N-acetylmuramoyl-L-alanine amidase [Candidatus Krumholzibacteria bacterium]|nr:N-acetylmuramoyl-L-alanine amidase [Candidatus Krumholzibacteria bacterium]